MHTSNIPDQPKFATEKLLSQCTHFAVQKYSQNPQLAYSLKRSQLAGTLRTQTLVIAALEWTWDASVQQTIEVWMNV